MTLILFLAGTAGVGHTDSVRARAQTLLDKAKSKAESQCP
jgi:hypothetical protein